MEESYVRMYDEMQGDMQSAKRHQAVKIGDEQREHQNNKSHFFSSSCMIVCAHFATRHLANVV